MFAERIKAGWIEGIRGGAVILAIIILKPQETSVCVCIPLAGPFGNNGPS